MPKLFRTGKIAAIILSVLLSACACCPPAVNLGDRKTELRDYHASGQYLRDVAETDGQAIGWIDRRAGEVRNPAIILDIDETSLSNWPVLAANDFGFRVDGPCSHLPKGPCGLTAYQQTWREAALMPTLAVYRAAASHHVAVFFITGRDESLRAATEKNLRRAGYGHWVELVMRPHGTTTPSAADYKAPQRARIEAEGYTIIANLGDQPSDLAGGHAERGFLVSNPFYRIR